MTPITARRAQRPGLLGPVAVFSLLLCMQAGPVLAGVPAVGPVPGISPSAGEVPIRLRMASPSDSLSEAELLDAELIQAYLPKADLGADRFLTQHPEADGRGVIVAILDTGIDLQHAGLLRTPSGERKIIDVYDATDNGLVDLPHFVQSPDSILPGLTGRQLRLGNHLSEDGAYHLGRLSAREIFPPGLLDRLLEERKKDRARLIAEWESATSADEGALGTKEPEKEEDSPAPPDRLKLYREVRREADREFEDPGPVFDLVALRREGAWGLLIDTDADGDLAEETLLAPYREAGDIALFPPPASLSMALSSIEEDGSRVSLFFDEGGHGTHVAGIVGAYYAPGDPLNGLAPGVRFLGVKVGNGRFGGSTSHNSILKAIDWAVEHGAMAANVSFGGTSHFGDGEEITSRFFDSVVQNHGIFITSSAGNEGPGLSTVGSPGTARRIFTLGAAISPSTILASYGGLRGPIASLPGLQLFPFSSRGPLSNGSPGVDFVSPGAAVSPLPTWLLTRNENWNGTSMAAPQGAGCIALLLSACIQEGIPVSPARMDRAMRAAAQPLAGATTVEQGAGAIRVPETYEALRGLARSFPVVLPAPLVNGRAGAGTLRTDAGPSSASAERTDLAMASGNSVFSEPLGAVTSSERDTAEVDPARPDSVSVPGVGVPATRDAVTFWRIRVENATGAGEGYYERNLNVDLPYWKTFQVYPDLPPKGAHALRDRFQRVVRLQSTVPWMEAPPQVAIPASGVSIRVKFDPSRMAPGLNVGRIRLLDVAGSGGTGELLPLSGAPGSETELLATVIRPERFTPPDYRLERVLEFPPGERGALFLEAPEGATRMRVRFSEELALPGNSYSVAATSLSLLHPPSSLRGGTRVDLRKGKDSVVYQAVEGGTTVELAIFARWTNPGAGRLRVTVEFDGVTGPEGLGSTAQLGGEQGRDARWGESPLWVHPGRHGTVIPLRAPLKDVHLTASARVTGEAEPLTLQWDLRPDSLYPYPLEEEHALIMRGRGWIRLDSEETVIVDLHDGPELEDFLDDSIYRLFDPEGRLVDAGNISSGPFDVHAPKDGPESGWYRIEFSVFTLGRGFVEDWSMFSPEVVRESSAGRLTLFRNPISGLSAGPDSSWTVSLLRGAQQPCFLRVQGLDDGKIYAGEISFRDEASAPPLLSIPLRVDTRRFPLEAEDALGIAVERLQEDARRALVSTPGAITPDPAELDQAEAHLRAWKGERYDISSEAWDLLFLRVDLALRQARAYPPRETKEAPAAAAFHGREIAFKEVERLLAEADRRLETERREEKRLAEEREKARKREPSSIAPGESPSDLAERETRLRRHEGGVLVRRADLEMLRGDLAAARRLLSEAARFAFGGETVDALEAELLLGEGHALQAVKPIRRAVDADPFNPLLAAREIEVYLALGWSDLAFERLESWPDRFPRERAMFLALVERAGEVKPAPEARSGSPAKTL